MARLGESTGTETDRIFFELDQFQLADDARLEVRGRWFGVRGRRFVRPTLMLQADGARHRALADLEHKPWLAEDGEPWEASFSCEVDGAEVREAELAVAPDIAIPLPAPNGRRRRPTRIAADGARDRRPGTRQRQSTEERREDELVAARLEIERLRSELVAARLEIERLRSELEASNEARLEAQGKRDHAARERDEARSAVTRAEAERDEARSALARVQAERDETLATYATLAQARDQALSERSAALSARAEMAVEHDASVRARDEAVRRHEQAVAERDRAIAELETHRHATQRIQAEREAEIAARGAAMVMRGAHRAAPVDADWTPRAIAIAVLVIAVLAAALVLHLF
jgi:hypothetical protein